MIIPINWSFERKSILPVIEVKGKSPLKESEAIMIWESVRIIEKASNFKGTPYPVPTCPASNISLCVSFPIIFPSEQALTNFLENIQKEK